MRTEAFVVTVDDDNINLIDRLELDKYSLKSSHSKLYDDNKIEGVMEPLYNPDYLVRLLDYYTYHASCVEAISTDVAGVDYEFLPINDEDSDIKDKEFLERVFFNIDINNVFHKVMYDRRTLGYGAIEIVYDDKLGLLDLVHVPAHRLRRHNDYKRAVYINNNGKRIWFTIEGSELDSDCDYETGEWKTNLSDDRKANSLIWTNEYNAGSEYYGRPPIISTLPSINGDLSAVRFNNSFFDNYGMPKFAITVSGDFEDYDIAPDEPGYDVTQTLRYRIGEQIKEIIKNPHSALCITIPSNKLGDEAGKVDINIIPLSVNAEEAHFRMYRKDVRDEVLHAHHVDPSRLGIYEAGTLNGGNSDNTMKSYKYGVIEPLKTEMETLINNLINKYLQINNWEFKLIDVSPIDYTKDLALAEFLFQRGAMTIRDLINNFGSKFGLDSNITEDSYYLDARYLNNVPLEQVWNSIDDNPVLERQTILDRISKDDEEESFKE